MPRCPLVPHSTPRLLYNTSVINFTTMIQIAPKNTSEQIHQITSNEGFVVAYSTESNKWIFMHIEAVKSNPQKYTKYFSPEDITEVTKNTSEMEQAVEDLFSFIRAWSVRSEATDEQLDRLKKTILENMNRPAVDALFDFININAVRSTDVSRILTTFRQKIMSYI